MELIESEINNKIYIIRGVQVMLDKDLAELYDVEVKNLNKAVTRNIERFPEKFRFQLKKEEYENLRFQFGTLSLDSENTWGRHTKYLPYVFTEQGVSMLSAVLRSKVAIEVSIKIMDSFVNMRKFFSNNLLFTEQFKSLETRQLTYEIKSNEKFDKIFKALESKDITPRQCIFYNGQIFDAHSFVSDLIREAKSSIKLIDNYIDDTTLSLFSKNQNISVVIYTYTISKSLKVDLEKYNKQYKEIEIKINKNFHDRFLIIDDVEVFHIGASLKDLGKKVLLFLRWILNS